MNWCLPLERDAATGHVARVCVLQLEVVRLGVGKVDRDCGSGRSVHWARRSGRCTSGERGVCVQFAQIALADNLAVQDHAIGFGGRIRETVPRFERKDIVTGGGDCERSRPANGIVRRLNLGNRERRLPIGLDERLCFGGQRAACDVGGGKELGLQPLAKGRARNGNHCARGECGPLCVENRG